MPTLNPFLSATPVLSAGYNPHEAENGKFVVLDPTTITDYPTLSGSGKYAMLVYPIGAGGSANTPTITKPFASATADWTYNRLITTNTAVTAIGASSSNKNYVTGIQFQNINSTSTALSVIDGSTCLWQVSATASMSMPVSVSFQTPLRGTAATALQVTAGTTGAAVIFNMQGYQAL